MSLPESSLQTPRAAPGARGLPETVWGLLVAIACSALFFWSAFQPAETWTFFSKAPQGIYPLQTAGFRSGHTFVAITPHAALLALRDPYDPVANAPYRVHDMSLFQGHYYMYYGPTPVLLFFWPLSALSGYYPTEPFATAIFCSAAVWVGIGLMLAVRRRHFPSAPCSVCLAAILCIAFASPINLLVIAPQFYQVPIACAIFLQTLMLGALYRSLHSRRWFLWFAAAGLLFGLSVGSRPNYLPELGILVFWVYALGRKLAVPGEDRRHWYIRGATFMALPAACCGLGLLIYNAERFGSPAELGTHYQLAGTRVTDLQQFGFGNFVSNLVEYFFKPGTWQSYFPFFAPDSVTAYGLLRYVPWYWLVIAAFLPWATRAADDRRGAWLIAVALGGSALGNLLLLSCFAVTNSRYLGDFSFCGILVAGAGALALGQKGGRSGHAWLPGWGIPLVALVSIAVSLAAFFDRLPSKDKLVGIERAGNWPAYAVERHWGANFGALRLDLRFPAAHPDLPEPLFETGRQPDQRDWLQVKYLGPDRARLGFFHAGTGEFPSQEFTIPADRHVVVEAQCGSLYPPFGHPIFRQWTRDEYDLARRDVKIRVNGTEVLQAALDCYNSSPANLRIGRFGWPTGGDEPTFSGEILGQERLPLKKTARVAPLFKERAPVELTLLFPSGKTGGSDPILVTGKGAESDLVYCVYDSVNHLHFAFDHYGAGGPQSESTAFDPLVPHKVVIWMGSLADVGNADGPASSGRLTVIFDGRPLLNVEQVFYPSSPDTLVVGYNAFGSTVTTRTFSGKIEGFGQLPPQTLPALQVSGSYGSVELAAQLPLDVLGTSEPLVVTGVAGAGDFVYIQYLDTRHVAIGFDHWGVGGLLGKPVEVDYGVPHHLSITIGSLYPPGSDPLWSRLVRVLLDGRTVLEGEWKCHPSSSSHIRIGKNPLGGSTCGPTFSGKILSVERLSNPND